MHMFKFGSRNCFDNYRKETVFRKNYWRTFKLKLPSGDAIEDLMRMLPPGELEKLKSTIVKELVRRKVFNKFRFLSKKYMISIDGTGVSAYGTNYCGECTHKTSKNGTVAYFHNVLEAKLVASNGMSISVASEWISNDTGKEYDKQDCEQKAFVRLAAKIKEAYPHMALVILADGLYPNKTFFKICKVYGWDFIVTIKDGNLPSVHQEIELLPDCAKKKARCNCAGKDTLCEQNFSWINNIGYQGFELSVIDCEETTTNRASKEKKKFTHVTNIVVNTANCYGISGSGRLRWRIENSFDYLKNHGYNLGHKFSRASFNAYKNYYQCMMSAHLINQFVEKCTDFVNLLKDGIKCTISYLWKRLAGYYAEVEINQAEYEKHVRKRSQTRLA